MTDLLIASVLNFASLCLNVAQLIAFEYLRRRYPLAHESAALPKMQEKEKQ